MQKFSDSSRREVVIDSKGVGPVEPCGVAAAALLVSCAAWFADDQGRWCRLVLSLLDPEVGS